MDDNQIIKDFIQANLSSIIDLAKSTFGKVDETLQIKLKSAYTAYLANTKKKIFKI
jgi:hypothetical protein